MLLMFTTIIAGATFAAILGAYAVQKIFYTLIGVFVYLYLFLSVGGSFDIKFAFVHEHPWATVICLLGGAFLLFLLVRRMWPRVLKLVGPGEGRRRDPRAPKQVSRPRLPAVIPQLDREPRRDGGLPRGVRHPCQFNTLMRICGGNSIANVTSVTPGGAGVTQAFNVASLSGVSDPTRRRPTPSRSSS